MAQKFLSIRQSDFERCQTKNGNSPWVKLHRDILGDPEFLKLSTHHRFLYLGLMVLATDCNNKIVNDHEFLRQRLYIMPTLPRRSSDEPSTDGRHSTDKLSTLLDLKPLYRGGFLQASNVHRELREREREGERDREGESADAPPAKVVPIPRASGFPEGFQFNQRAEDMAKGYGLNVHKEFAAFRDHHVAKGSVFKDWDAAFRTWLRNAVKFAAKVAR